MRRSFSKKILHRTDENVATTTNDGDIISNIGSHKNNRIAGATPLSLSSSIASRNTNITKLYMGNQLFECRHVKEPLHLIQIYLKSMADVVYGYLSTLHCNWDENTYYQNAPTILPHLFQSILRYHKIFTPYTMQLYTVPRNVCLGEPLFYRIRENELDIFVNQPVIENILKNRSDPTLFQRNFEHRKLENARVRKQICPPTASVKIDSCRRPCGHTLHSRI